MTNSCSRLMRVKLLMSTAGVLLIAACSGRVEVSPELPPYPLNDTGSSFCRDLSGVSLECGDAPAQDGTHGRDISDTAKQGSGPLGFDWTKLNRAGEPLSDQTQTWQTSGTEAASQQWSCVKDYHTGLTWEVKSDDASAVNLASLRYTWYDPNPQTNGEDPGAQNTDDCNGVACNSMAYVDYLNSMGWCGRSNWRLPSTNELLSLVVTDNLDLVLDTRFFPNGVNDQYWSHQTYIPIRERAWYLYFSDGSFGFTIKNQPNFLRLVSEASSQTANLVNTNGGEQ